jgi:hypothetical protein
LREACPALNLYDRATLHFMNVIRPAN